MIRKAALQIAAFALLAFIAFNGYLAINHLKRIQQSAALARESSLIQANIAEVLQDFTDMETGQRGYLVTGDPAYLQPYTDAKGRIGGHFASLRSQMANRAEPERSLEAQLESLEGSRKAEMERTISLREQGYRHRAFLLVGTNEADYMNRVRGVVSSLSSMESNSFSRFEEERNAYFHKALSETIVLNSCLLVMTVGLFLLIRYHARGLEHEAAQGQRMVALRDSRLEELTSALRDQTRYTIPAIQQNVRLLLEKYGGFLPPLGYECAEQIKETVAQMERLRKDLLGHQDSDIREKVA